MINEQRALTTLDLTLKNAFETLNKFSVWASTPNADVTFNLLDAMPTLNSNGSGIFLKPIKVPSFNSITTTIFGPIGNTSSRTINWGLTFQANGNDWTFQNYSPAGNSSSPVATGKKSNLNVLVDSKFGNVNTKVKITNTNVQESGYSYSATYDAASSISFSDNTHNGVVYLSALTSSLKSPSLLLGADVTTGVASSTLSARLKGLTISNGSRNILQYSFVNNTGKNTIHLGSLNSTYDTTVMGGNVSILGYSGRSLALSVGSEYVHDLNLLSSIPSTKGYDISLAVPDNTTITSMIIGDVTSLDLAASNRFFLHSANDYIDSNDTDGDFVIGSTKKLQLNGGSSLVLASDSKVSIGIDTESGITEEIVVTKGMVTIPNLFISKKSNFSLSGLKHRSVLYPALSLEYIPLQKESTSIPKGYSSAVEYVVDIVNKINVNLDNVSEYDVTINDFSGTKKSYLVFYKDSRVYMYTSNASSGNNLEGAYSQSTLVTSIPSIIDSVEYPRVFSSDNYMYIIVIRINSIDIYYSSDSAIFTKLTSIANRGDYSYDLMKDFSMDITSKSSGIEDSIWMACSYDLDAASTFRAWSYNQDQGRSGTDIINVYNNCGVPVVTRNPNGFQGAFPSIRVDNPTGYGYQVNASAKIKSQSYINSLDGTTYAIIAVPVFYSDPNTVGSTSVVGTAYAKAVVHNNVVAFLDEGVYYTGGSIYYAPNYTKPYSGSGPGSYEQAGRIIDFMYPPNNTGEFTSYVNYDNLDSRTSYNKILSQSTTNKHLVYSYVSIKDTSIRLNSMVDIDTGNIYTQGNIPYNLDSPAGSTKIGYSRVLASDCYSRNNPTGIAYTIGQSEYLLTLNGGTGYVKGSYDINGSYVDYFNVGASILPASDYRFMYSNTVSGRNNYKLKTVSPIDEVDTSSIYSKDNELVAIVDMSSTSITCRDINDLLYKETSSTPIEVFSCSTSAMYVTLDGSVASNLSKGSYAGESYSTIIANIHIEPISYIAKNRNVDIDGVSFAGYTINRESNFNGYRLVLENNSRSGYKIPFYSKLKNSQISQSSYNTSKSNTAGSVDFEHNQNGIVYVVTTASYTYVIFLNSEDVFSYDGEFIIINDAHVVIKIENRYLDPNHGDFDSTVSIVNEFGNVVSIRCDYISGFRSGNTSIVNPASITTGLTEIGQSGGGC